MRYWRHYPKFLQTILLMLLIFTLTSFSFAVASFGVSKIFGVEMESLSSMASPNIIHAAQFVQAISSTFTFLLSAVLFAHLTHPAPAGYLGLRRPPNTTLTLASLLLLFCALPAINELGVLMQEFDFGKAAKSSFEAQKKMTHSMMSGTNSADLILYLLLFAALPALGEEFLFRGVVMRFAYGNTRNIHFAILFSAAIFAMAHGSAYNFLPIMLAGLLLGYLYYYTRSIWVSILAHFFNNAFAVLALFLSNKGVISNQIGETEHVPLLALLVSLALFVFVFYFVQKNATPLPKDWHDDFKEDLATE